MSDCQFVSCTLKGPARVTDHDGRSWGLCVRHAAVVDRAVAGHFIVDVMTSVGKGEHLLVRTPGRYSDGDWDAHYRMLQRPDHAIVANGAAFAPVPRRAPPDVLICACGWRGHYRMWPQHVRSTMPLPPHARPD